MIAAQRTLGIAAATLLMMLAGCTDDEPSKRGGDMRKPPCSNGEVHDLGVPNPFDRYASFEVVQGPVWFGVQDWQSGGVIDPRGEQGTLKLGPLGQPPEADSNGHIPSQSDQIVVEKDLWSRLDLTPGSYWLLGPGNAGHISIQTCGEAAVRAVAPAE